MFLFVCFEWNNKYSKWKKEQSRDVCLGPPKTDKKSELDMPIFVERKAFVDKGKRKQGEAERAFRKQRTSGTCERAAGKRAGWEET